MIRVRGVAAGAALAAVLAAAPGAATARQDTTALAADTLVPGFTLQGADSTPEGPAVTMSPEIASGPLAPGTRYTLTRDSVLWSSAITLADVLGSLPGVYVARAGFLGQPEYVLYAGRGPASLEIYWDGVRQEPMGGDSVYLDPSQYRLTYLSRIDVEVWPSTLRVHLVTERHDRYEPRSFLRVMSGAFSTAEYAGTFERRWPGGLGLALGADFTGSDGAAGVNRNDQNLDLWGRFEWLPTARTGASFQIRRQSLDRDPVVGASAPSPPDRDGTRTETAVRFFAGTRIDGWGAGVEGGVVTTSWTNDSVAPEQTVRQAYARVRYAMPTLSVEAEGRVGDDRVRSGVRARAGWVPVEGVVVSGHGEWQRHSFGRESRTGTASVGLYTGPLSVAGQVSWRDGVQAPALADDLPQQTGDAALRVGLRTAVLTGHVALVRRGAFLPLPIPDFSGLPTWDSTAAATYLLADVTFRPVQPLALTAWYSDPMDGTGSALQPPAHGRAAVTFRSKFWRTFRSGVYDLMLQYAVEFWSDGVAGATAAGEPVALPGATFHEMFAQIQLADFKVFWNLRNARNALAQYVPGLPYPRNAQTFGVKWEFFN